MKLLGFFRRRREEKALSDAQAQWGKAVAAFKALGSFQKRALSDSMAKAGARVADAAAAPASIPVAVWLEGRLVSHPEARILCPPPEVLHLRRPRAYRSIEDVVNDLTGEPQIDRFILRYVGKDPRAAVYLHEAEVLAMKEGA